MLVCIAGQLSSRFVAKIANRLDEFKSEYEVHVLFCCDGGELDAGLSLYHCFSKFSGNMTLYVASAKSAGAIAMLGAPKKKMLPYGAVMFHAAVSQIPGFATINDLRAAVERATNDDGQLKVIINKHAPNITALEWDKYSSGCFAPDFERLVELGLFVAKDRCDFPAGGCITIAPDAW